MLGKGLVRVRGRSDDGQVVTWMSGECQGKPGERQVNFRWSLNSLNQGKVRVLWGSGEGQMMVRWSGEHQVNIRWISIWAWLCWTWNLLFCVIGWRAVWCWDQSDIKHLVNHNNNLITPAEMGEGEQTQFILLNILLSNFLQNDDFHWIL